MLDHDAHVSDYELNGFKKPPERAVAEKGDFMMGLTDIYVLVSSLSIMSSGKTTCRAVTRKILLLPPPSAIKKPPVPAVQAVDAC